VSVNKVFNHPQKEEIISKLLNGESVKSVDSWLKKKHPKKKSLWVSYASLQKFRKEHLNLDGDILQNIKEARKTQDSDSEDLAEKAMLATSNAYQEKINEIASMELDANKKFMELIVLISSRMEFYFNTINSGTAVDLKKDRLFLELVNAQRGLLQDWKKYVDGFADQKIDHNININVVNEQITVLKNIIFEIVQEMSPSMVPIFIEKLNQKLNGLNYDSPQYRTYQEIAVIDAE
jgi:DNA-directed RNA polymerase beta' subunit